MIAERDHIGPRIAQLAVDFLRDPETMCSVLAVENDKIGLISIPHQRQLAQYSISSGSADHVAEEDQPHAWGPASVRTWSSL